MASEIREQIAEISQRTISIAWDAPCSKCGAAITLPPQVGRSTPLLHPDTRLTHPYHTPDTP
jgi:hypothetical protein